MLRGLTIKHAVVSLTRRAVLAGASGGVSSILAGCASSTDSISGTVDIRTDSDATVAVELIRPDGVINLGRGRDLRPDDSIEFPWTDPAGKHALRTNVRSGATRTDQWLTSDCRAVTIALLERAIAREFEDC